MRSFDGVRLAFRDRIVERRCGTIAVVDAHTAVKLGNYCRNVVRFGPVIGWVRLPPHHSGSSKLKPIVERVLRNLGIRPSRGRLIFPFVLKPVK